MKWFDDLKISTVLIVCAAIIVLGNITKAQPNFGDPVSLDPNINSSSADVCPVISADGCTMYFASDRPGGYGDMDIYVAIRKSIDDEWEPAVNLGPNVNTSNYEAPWSISTDGLSLYMSSNRTGGSGTYDLWVITRATVLSPWVAPVNLGPTVNSSSYEYHPLISSDGLSLYFSSSRSGGTGGYDIWVSTRTTTSSLWGTPVNLWAINSSSNDYQPRLSSDGLSLFFASTKSGGYGPADIYVTTRASLFNNWDSPVNLGLKINTSADDCMPDISADGSTFYFTSNGHGGYGYYDIFEAPIFDVPTCGDLNHPYPVGDLNMDCHVDVYDLLIFIDHWLDCTAPECDEVL
jgi:Tol biopolymer transport system component